MVQPILAKSGWYLDFFVVPFSWPDDYLSSENVSQKWLYYADENWTEKHLYN